MLQFILGIDPSARKEGFAIAIIDLKEKNVRFKRFKDGYLDFARWLPEHGDYFSCTMAAVENSHEQKGVNFWTHKDAKGNLLTQAHANQLKRKGRRVTKLKTAELIAIAQKVGMNMLASVYTVKELQKYLGKKRVVSISPKEKGEKWSEVIFKSVAKTEGHFLMDFTGSQDEIDAYNVGLKGYKKLLFDQAMKKMV